jgi:hypothetical protein
VEKFLPQFRGASAIAFAFCGSSTENGRHAFRAVSKTAWERRKAGKEQFAGKTDADWARRRRNLHKSLTKDANSLAASRTNKLYRFYMFFALRCQE